MTTIQTPRPTTQIMARQPSRENSAINALRATAALLVVFSHLRILFFSDYDHARHNFFNSLFYFLTSLGHESVVVFFVLSGYWVGGAVNRQVQQNRFTWNRYATQRLTRLWLVLIPAVGLTAVLDFLGKYLHPTSDLYSDVGAQYHNVVPVDLSAHTSIVDAIGNILFLGAIRVPTFGTNGPLWSLSYEFAYYALFPIIIISLRRETRWGQRAIYLAIFTILCFLMGSLVLALGLVWLLGVAISVCQDRIKSMLTRFHGIGFIQLTGLVFLIGGFLCAKIAESSFTGPTASWISTSLVALPASAFLATLVKDVHGPGLVKRVVGRYSLTAGSSYSLYVIHCPLLVFAASFIVPHASNRFVPGYESLLITSLLTLGCVAAAWMFSLPTERQTERVRKRIDRHN